MVHLPLLKVRRSKIKSGGLSIFKSVEVDSRGNLSGSKRNGKVQTCDQRAVAHPVVGAVGKPGRRLVLIERLAHLADGASDLRVAVGSAIQSPNRRDRILERRFHFLTVGS